MDVYFFVYQIDFLLSGISLYNHVFSTNTIYGYIYIIYIHIKYYI